MAQSWNILSNVFFLSFGYGGRRSCNNFFNLLKCRLNWNKSHAGLRSSFRWYWKSRAGICVPNFPYCRDHLNILTYTEEYHLHEVLLNLQMNMPIYVRNTCKNVNFFIQLCLSYYVWWLFFSCPPIIVNTFIVSPQSSASMCLFF